ncbi:lactosylceramide 4-alpha-galactosyltransferase-like [Dermacentor variabilis]|uniref:lactosylceramide 4-alpha-galactosyltransferase-like n=1 Tax=Dermacentor variabilis TaxID=34621 RepID=UPI003F5BFE64
MSHSRVPSTEAFWKQPTQRAKGNTESAKNDQDHIWFLETSYKQKLLAREACSIESACRSNADFTVHLLSTGNISSSGCPYHRLLSKLPNFRSAGLNAGLELAGTSLEPLYNIGGALHESAGKVEHLSDFLRYILLWKHGGVYLDTDVIVMKSLKGISNSVFYESENKERVLTNSILFFDKQHPVLRWLINECASVYDPHLWTVCGPALMSRLPSDGKLSRRVKFLGNSYFFRVPYASWQNLFSSTMAPGVLRTINGSYGVHFWNKLSKGKRVVPGSGCAIDVLARAYCPETYRLAISAGYF